MLFRSYYERLLYDGKSDEDEIYLDGSSVVYSGGACCERGAGGADGIEIFTEMKDSSYGLAVRCP